MEKVILNCECSNRYTFYVEDGIKFVEETMPTYAEYAGRYWLIEGKCPTCIKKEES